MKPALLIIDTQIGLIDGLPAHDGPQVMQRIQKLRESAHEAGAPVIYIQHSGEPGHPLEPGKPGWPIHPAIAPVDEKVVPKTTYSSFSETTLQDDLQKLGVTNLVITGAMSEYCVDTTARHAALLGYDVTLVSDAHTTGDTKHLKASQIIQHHNQILDGFRSGDHEISVKPAAEVKF